MANKIWEEKEIVLTWVDPTHKECGTLRTSFENLMIL